MCLAKRLDPNTGPPHRYERADPSPRAGHAGARPPRGTCSQRRCRLAAARPAFSASPGKTGMDLLDSPALEIVATEFRSTSCSCLSALERAELSAAGGWIMARQNNFGHGC